MQICSCIHLLDKNTCKYAAYYGHLECLKYAHENGCPWDKYTCEYAAYNGHLECLKYAHENGCPWGADTCINAVTNGHLECLKYAHENGCSWDESICEKAAEYGHLECLKYALEHNCPYTKNDEIIKYIKICWEARRRWHKAQVISKYVKLWLMYRRNKAAIIIQRAYLQHLYKPKSGYGYIQAKEHFEHFE